MGLATDYCVKFTVLDALELGYAVNVITDGCRGVNIHPQDSAHAFMEMAAAGATLYTLADWEETPGPGCRQVAEQVSYPVNTSRNGETIA
ncbi:nicotinamidase/pyrazinamidase [Salmonella enterica subsp. enterica]|uniref:nicotinamidase n=1 Tax=Salmonella enterica I TaxID=59201 RepID=A0A379VSJ5_SALET|nr:nicotinamidase/pyrazinamidase [Salmonella enterica subsp. enterica]